MALRQFRSGRILSMMGMVLLYAFSAKADLAWKSMTIRAPYEQGQTEVRAQFAFKNKAAGNARIREVRPGCGCTATHLDKTLYTAGEEGNLEVIFTVGDRSGLQQKVIAVSEDGKKAPTILTLEVQLPEPVQVSKKTLSWDSNETPAAKELAVVAQSGIQIADVVVTNPTFEIATTKQEGDSLVMTVCPKKTDVPLSALLRIKYTGKSSGQLSIPLQVK